LLGQTAGRWQSPSSFQAAVKHGGAQFGIKPAPEFLVLGRCVEGEVLEGLGFWHRSSEKPP
jgi:hypothetical protein